MDEVAIKNKNPNFLNQGGLSVLIGGGSILVNLLLSSMGWVSLVLGILLVGGAVLMVYKALNRLVAFLMLLIGMVLILKNFFYIGFIIDISIYLVGAVLIVVGSYGLVRHYTKD